MRKLLLLFFVLCTGFVFGQFPTFDGVDLRQYVKTRKYMYFVPNASPPAGVKMGAVYFDTDTTLYYFNGLTWLPVGGTDYFHLRGSSPDTITASYNILQDSSFLMKHGNWYAGYWDNGYGNDPLDDNFDTTIILGFSDGTEAAMMYVGNGDNYGRSIHARVADDAGNSSFDLIPGNISMITDSSITITTVDKIGMSADTTVLSGENIYLPDITATGKKFEHLVGISPDGRLFPQPLSGTLDSMLYYQSVTPTVFSHFTRDTTNGYLYPAHLTDKVGIGTNSPAQQLHITGNIRIPSSTATTGIIYKDANRFLHTFTASGTTGRNLFFGEYAGNLTLTGAASGQQGSYLLGIGTYSLQANTTGYQNIGVGDNTLAFTTSGYQNIAIGTEAGKNITTGYACVAIGHGAMAGSSDSAVTSVAVGNSALSLSNRACNVAVGSSALMDLTLGLDNVGIGTGAGLHRDRGNGNIAIGVYSQGRYNMAPGTINGDGNNSIGTYTLAALTTGAYNVAIGDSSGYSITTGSGNIFLGAKAGFNTTLSNRLIIDNTKRASAAADTTSALLFGNFSLPRLTINGHFWVNVGGERYIHDFSGTGTAGRNNFIGLYSGNKTLTGSDTGDEGSYNNGFGQYSLSSLTVGRDNTAMGEQTNYNATTGSYNVSIGNYSMKNNLTASNNTAVGYQAHQGSSTPANNIGIGNVAVGDRALAAVTSADYTTAIGQFAGTAITSGDNNTLIGRMSGYTKTSGAGNIYIGYAAGNDASFATTSNELIIENSNSTAPLIYGKFDTDLIKVNGSFSSATGTIADNDATPTVAGANTFVYAGSANAVTITDLDNPTVGEYYTLIGNSDTYTITIDDSGNFKLSAQWVGGVDDALYLYCKADNYYVEVSRSNN